MMLPTDDQLYQISHADLVALVRALIASGERLKAYADLLSVIATSKIKGQRVFETLVNLMGHPVLQFLNASSP